MDLSRVKIVVDRLWGNLSEQEKARIPFAMRALTSNKLGRFAADKAICPGANSVVGDIQKVCVGQDIDGYRELFVNVLWLTVSDEDVVNVSRDEFVQGAKIALQSQGRGGVEIVVQPFDAIIDILFEYGIDVNTSAVVDANFGDNSDVIGDEDESSYAVTNESDSKVAEDDIDKSGDEDINTEDDSEDSTPSNLSALIESCLGGTITTDVLMQRYSLLFKSGYDMYRPFGLLTSSGVAYVNSDGYRVYRDLKDGLDKVQSLRLFNLFKDELLKFEESPARSVPDMIAYMLDGYKRGILYYFPNKLLEVAYGRSMVGAQGDIAKYNYAKDSKGQCGGDWGRYSNYCKEKVDKLLWVLISDFCKVKGYTSEQEILSNESEITGFAEYILSCLSVCPLLVEYKYNSNHKAPTSIRFRYCDPKGSIDSGKVDVLAMMCQQLNITKDTPKSVTLNSSLDPILSSTSRVIEFAHEFDHELNNALPLFAYKAYEALAAKGVTRINYKDMILGQNTDGTILQNGGKVALSNNLIHFINAGSRSGKGVMTLNMLSGAIMSEKAVFYLDDKPDIIITLANMCGDENAMYPSMFALNGAYIGDSEENLGVFRHRDKWISAGNIPLEARYVFQDNPQAPPTWKVYGDLFYMRAFLLAYGMMIARGKRGSSVVDELNGKNGLFIVCDESSVFQNGFSTAMDKVYAKMPMAKEKIKELENNIESLISEINTSDKPTSAKKKLASLAISSSGMLEASNFYALSFANSLAKSLPFLADVVRSGFDPEEFKYSDLVFVGQDLNPVAVDYNDLVAATTSERMKSGTGAGLPKQTRIDLNKYSVPFAVFTAAGIGDALIGYNPNYPGYLEQTKPTSNAYGRLDKLNRGFCYIPSSKFDTRSSTPVGKQIQAAGFGNDPSLVYFKPYMLLNESYNSDGSYSRFVNQAVSFLEESNYHLDDLVAEYPSYTDSSRLHEAVGIRDYMDLMQVPKEVVANALRKSALLANLVLTKYIHYPDDGSGRPLWLQYVTDLRPEWMLSVADIALLCYGSYEETNVALGENNPITREYNDVIAFKNKYKDILPFDNTMTSMCDTYVDENGNRQLDISGYEGIGRDFDAMDDYSDMESEEENFQSRTEGYFEDPDDYDSYADDGEVFEDIFGDAVVTNRMGSYSEPIAESTGNPEIDTLLAQIAELTKQVQELSAQGSRSEYRENGGVNMGYANGMTPVPFTSDSFDDVEYDEDTGVLTGSSLQNIITAVSEKVISEFGDTSRIHTVRVCGGALVINNEVVTCQLDKSCVGLLPLDIRRQVATGNISELFDYRYLRLMPNLRVLQFDSTEFVYDIVNPYLGYKRSLAINAFFEDFKSLQALTIGKYSFNRDTYKSDMKANQLFEHQSKAAKIAALCTGGSAKATKACASFTKNSMRSKTTMGKVFGVTAGVVGTAVTGAITGVAGATTGVARGISKVSRRSKTPGNISRGVKSIRSSIKNLFDE